MAASTVIPTFLAAIAFKFAGDHYAEFKTKQNAQIETVMSKARSINQESVSSYFDQYNPLQVKENRFFYNRDASTSEQVSFKKRTTYKPLVEEANKDDKSVKTINEANEISVRESNEGPPTTTMVP